MLYQFWSVSKSGTEISTRFIQAVVKTWNFSEEKFRCEVLIGFPRRILTKQSEVIEGFQYIIDTHVYVVSFL